MNAYGIDFTHRRPEQRDYVARDYAEFMAFAALCDSMNVARYVDGVFFDTKCQIFNIDVDEQHAYTPVGLAIRECAQQALMQYVMFGDYWCEEAHD